MSLELLLTLLYYFFNVFVNLILRFRSFTHAFSICILEFVKSNLPDGRQGLEIEDWRSETLFMHSRIHAFMHYYCSIAAL